jgi:hypothetical protein
MNAEQLNLFADTRQRDALESHKESWRYCWNWDGPEVGGYCQLDVICATLETPYAHPDTGALITQTYAYMERCRLIEKRADGKWLAVIDMGIVHGEPWYKNGTRIIMDELEVWPSVRDINAERLAGRGGE